MQTKPNRKDDSRDFSKRKNPYKPVSADPSRLRASKNKNDKKPNKEEALIDLYEDPFKRTKEEENEEIVINIDFTKPLELLNKIYKYLKKVLKLALVKLKNIDRSKLKLSALKKNKTKSLAVAGGLVILLGAFIGIKNLNNSDSVVVEEGVQGVATPTVVTQDAPEFSLLYPDGKTYTDYESLAVVSPPGTPKTYAYKDSIDNIVIQVSQQLLPDNLKTNQEQELKDLATGFSATNRIRGGGVDAYMGQYDIGGPQSVIAIIKDRLVLIKSERPIESQSWANYLEKLN